MHWGVCSMGRFRVLHWGVCRMGGLGFLGCDKYMERRRREKTCLFASLKVIEACRPQKLHVSDASYLGL